jgi:hypothetical protein
MLELEVRYLKTRDSWWDVIDGKKTRVAKLENNMLIITNGISRAENRRQNGDSWKEYKVCTADEVSRILRQHFL